MTAKSALLAGAGLVDASATLRARAVRYGWADSAEATATFTIGGR